MIVIPSAGTCHWGKVACAAEQNFPGRVCDVLASQRAFWVLLTDFNNLYNVEVRGGDDDQTLHIPGFGELRWSAGVPVDEIFVIPRGSRGEMVKLTGVTYI